MVFRDGFLGGDIAGELGYLALKHFLEKIWCKYIPGPSSLGAKWFRCRVSIYHPLGFTWHPLEGAGS